MIYKRRCGNIRIENPTNWFDLLSQALINIPTKEYCENYQPPMTVALVEKIFITANYEHVATRGQFVTKDNWQRNDLSRHWNNIQIGRASCRERV